MTQIRGDDAARIESYIDRDALAPCHRWTGSPNRKGACQTMLEGRLVYAHVAVWVLENGPLPEGMTLDHECHNEAARRGECAGGTDCLHRRCVNPVHLVPKPIGENTRSSVNTFQAKNAAKSHCGPRGHEFDEANTYWYLSRTGTPCRGCRACHAIRQAETRARRRNRAA